MSGMMLVTMPARVDGRASAAAAAVIAEAGATRVILLRHRPRVDPRSVYDPTPETPPPAAEQVTTIETNDLAGTTQQVVDREQPDLVLAFGWTNRCSVWLGDRARHTWPAPVAVLAEFYRDPVARAALLVTSLVLGYLGGAAMFYVHAVHFQEGGPAISPYLHWAVDCTFGWLALTPLLALILPFATWLAGRGTDRFRPWRQAVATGVLFTLATTPGPVGHDLLVGRGTPIANAVTRLFGNPNAVLPPAANYSEPAKMAQQFVAGLPVYLVLSAACLWVIRGFLRERAMTETASRSTGRSPA